MAKNVSKQKVQTRLPFLVVNKKASGSEEPEISEFIKQKPLDAKVSKPPSGTKGLATHTPHKVRAALPGTPPGAFRPTSLSEVTSSSEWDEQQRRKQALRSTPTTPRGSRRQPKKAGNTLDKYCKITPIIKCETPEISSTIDIDLTSEDPSSSPSPSSRASGSVAASGVVEPARYSSPVRRWEESSELPESGAFVGRMLMPKRLSNIGGGPLTVSNVSVDTGSAGTGSAGTGSAGTGSAGIGSAGTGSAGTGSAGTGSAGTGSASTGSAGNFSVDTCSVDNVSVNTVSVGNICVRIGRSRVISEDEGSTIEPVIILASEASDKNITHERRDVEKSTVQPVKEKSSLELTSHSHSVEVPAVVPLEVKKETADIASVVILDNDRSAQSAHGVNVFIGNEYTPSVVDIPGSRPVAGSELIGGPTAGSLVSTNVGEITEDSASDIAACAVVATENGAASDNTVANDDTVATGNGVATDKALSTDTVVSLVSDTAMPLVSDTAASLVSDTAVSLVSDTSMSLASDTVVSLISDTAVSLVSDTVASLVSDTAASLVSDTAMPLVSDTVVSLVSDGATGRDQVAPCHEKVSLSCTDIKRPEKPANSASPTNGVSSLICDPAVVTPSESPVDPVSVALEAKTSAESGEKGVSAMTVDEAGASAMIFETDVAKADVSVIEIDDDDDVCMAEDRSANTSRDDSALLALDESTVSISDSALVSLNQSAVSLDVSVLSVTPSLTPSVAGEGVDAADKPNTTPTVDQLKAKKRYMSPAMVAKQVERKAEKERLQKEKDEKKAELKLKKEEEKKAKDEEKEKERLKAQEEKKRKAAEKEKEKQKKEEEIEAKKEEKRKRDEEKLQKEVEKKKVEGEKKQREANQRNIIKNYFKPKKPTVKADPEEEECPFIRFKPFQVPTNTRVSPIIRVLNYERSTLDKYLEHQNSDASYLTDLRTKTRVPLTSARTLPPNDDKVEIIVDGVLCKDGGKETPTRQAMGLCYKFMYFHKDHRPPYYGTWRKQSKEVGPRRPLGKDSSHLDYEVDSEEEWEEEVPGESLSSGSEDEEDDREEEEIDPECRADGFMVEHGYLSEGEGGEEEADELTSAERKERLMWKKKEYEKVVQSKGRIKIPKIIGICWEDEIETSPDMTAENTSQRKKLSAYKLNMNVPLLIPTLESDPTLSETTRTVSPMQKGGPKTRTVGKRRPVPDEALPDLIRLVHGNRYGINRLILEFIEFWKLKCHQNAEGEDSANGASKTSLISKRQLDLTIKSIAAYEKRGQVRTCWYVSDEVINQYQLSESVSVPTQWQFVTKPQKETVRAATPSRPMEQQQLKVISVKPSMAAVSNKQGERTSVTSSTTVTASPRRERPLPSTKPSSAKKLRKTGNTPKLSNTMSIDKLMKRVAQGQSPRSSAAAATARFRPNSDSFKQGCSQNENDATGKLETVTVLNANTNDPTPTMAESIPVFVTSQSCQPAFQSPSSSAASTRPRRITLTQCMDANSQESRFSDTSNHAREIGRSPSIGSPSFRGCVPSRRITPIKLADKPKGRPVEDSNHSVSTGPQTYVQSTGDAGGFSAALSSSSLVSPAQDQPRSDAAGPAPVVTVPALSPLSTRPISGDLTTPNRKRAAPDGWVGGSTPKTTRTALTPVRPAAVAPALVRPAAMSLDSSGQPQSTAAVPVVNPAVPVAPALAASQTGTEEKKPSRRVQLTQIIG